MKTYLKHIKSGSLTITELAYKEAPEGFELITEKQFNQQMQQQSDALQGQWKTLADQSDKEAVKRSEARKYKVKKLIEMGLTEEEANA